MGYEIPSTAFNYKYQKALEKEKTRVSRTLSAGRPLVFKQATFSG